MSKWGENPVKKVCLTKVQLEDLEKSVIEMGKSRLKGQGRIAEVDFFMGAMAVMSALAISPPSWVWSILAGISLIDKEA